MQITRLQLAYFSSGELTELDQYSQGSLRAHDVVRSHIDSALSDPGGVFHRADDRGKIIVTT